MVGFGIGESMGYSEKSETGGRARRGKKTEGRDETTEGGGHPPSPRLRRGKEDRRQRTDCRSFKREMREKRERRDKEIASLG
jgi:hypothetical protein